MNSVIIFAGWLLHLTFALAAVKSGIFTSIDSIDPSPDSRPETDYWLAIVSWSITSSLGIQAGDTFALRLPYVFSFSSKSQILTLDSDAGILASCLLYSGESDDHYSEVQCTATDKVEGIASASGKLAFSFVFNAGFSADDVDIAAAGYWGYDYDHTPISWTDGSNMLQKTIRFDKTPGMYIDKFRNIFHDLRASVKTPTKRHYFLGNYCEVPSLTGYLKITHDNPEVPFDCKNLQANFASEWNIWKFPHVIDQWAGKHTSSCSPTEVVVTFSEVLAFYRPFINVPVNVLNTRSLSTYVYSYEFLCMGVTFKGSLEMSTSHEDLEKEDNLSINSSETAISTEATSSSETTDNIELTSSETSSSKSSSFPFTSYTTTWTSVGSNDISETDSGVVIAFTDSNGNPTTTTSQFPNTNNVDSQTTYTTTWTTVNSDGNSETDSGVVIVTTDSNGILTTTTSQFPPSETSSESSSELIGFTTYTTTWTTNGDDGDSETDSGVVIVTTDSDGSLTTTTSQFPHGETSSESSSEHKGFITYTTTWTTAESEGDFETDSGVVIVTADSEGSLTTTTSQFPPSETSSQSSSELTGFTTYTTTWTTTDSKGESETDSAVVIVTSDSVGSLTTTASQLPSVQVSSNSSSELTGSTTYITTWTTSDSDDKSETDSGVVIVTIDSDGSLTTTTSQFPNGEISSESSGELTGFTTYTTTLTTSDAEGDSETDSGVVIVTTDADGSLTTTTSQFPPNQISSELSSELTGFTTYTTTWTTTVSDGDFETDSGVLIVTTDSDGALTTTTSQIPPSQTSSIELTGFTTYTTTWTTSNSYGDIGTDSGVVIVTSDADGSLITTTSLFPMSSSESGSELNWFTTYITTWVSTESEGGSETDSGIVIVTTDSEGSLTTTTSQFPPIESSSAWGSELSGFTTYTTTWASSDTNGNAETNSGTIIVTTDSNGSLITTTSQFPHSVEGQTTYTTPSNSNGSIETDSGIVIVATDSEGSLTTTTSQSLPSQTSGAKTSGITTYTTTWTTTVSAGITETDSGVVIVCTDSHGSLTTTTSQFPHTVAGPQTTYTSTWTTTDVHGHTVTESGVICVSTDAHGSLTTSVSKCSDSNEVAATHTKTLTTTDSHGHIVTQTEVVCVTTDIHGHTVTETEVICVTTDAHGLLTTSTVKGSHGTLYTSTTVCTDRAGEVFTKTLVICESTAANNQLTTVTSVLPRTTTLVSTDKKGALSTYTAAIVESTVQGTVTYHTSIFPESATLAGQSGHTAPVVSHTAKAASATSTNVVNTNAGAVFTNNVAAEGQASKSSTLTLQPQTTLQQVHTSAGAGTSPSVSSYEATGSLPTWSFRLLTILAFFAII